MISLGRLLAQGCASVKRISRGSFTFLVSGCGLIRKLETKNLQPETPGNERRTTNQATLGLKRRGPPERASVQTGCATCQLANFDFDRFRLCLLGLGQLKIQHAILEFRLHLLLVHKIGQCEAPDEAPIRSALPDGISCRFLPFPACARLGWSGRPLRVSPSHPLFSHQGSPP